ncbi:hypothetical protein [Actinoplanes derwentensis]|uniref:hypothetical protein n=1 Tax=Actinoplanes derwentensis TaxID=113562 RepID=UPI000B84705B|nr:hypothetical protein [Actinoplanes derwentensis]GID84489.1 hypothetical protein Ade03nite_34130 [Actinoplanes derwentensis]
MTSENAPDPATRPDCPSLCLVCGLDHRPLPAEDWPWGPDGTLASFEMCDCCGSEFGYQDATLAACRRSRRIWTEAGHPWSVPSARPPGWNPSAQLAALPLRACQPSPGPQP